MNPPLVPGTGQPSLSTAADEQAAANAQQLDDAMTRAMNITAVARQRSRKQTQLARSFILHAASGFAQRDLRVN